MSYPNNPPVPASITVDTTASINSGLVGFWPLTTTTGNTTEDISGQGNDATKTGAAWENTGVGYAFEQAPTEAGLNAGSSANNFHGSSFSVSAWVWTDEVASTGSKWVWGCWNNSNGSIAMRVRVNQIWVYHDAGYSLYATNAVEAKTWHHVLVTYDGSAIRIYVDGALAKIDSRTLGASNTEPFYIGQRDSSTSDSFDGYIQNVRTYDRALTPTEVTELHSVPWAGTDYVAQNLTPDTPIAMGVDPNHSLSSGLVGYWPLSDGSGTVAKDMVGGNDGTLSGVAGWTASDKGVALNVPSGTGNVSIGTTSDFVFSDTGTMSVSFWAYFDNDNTRYAVIGTGITTAGNDWFIMREYLGGTALNSLRFGLNYNNTPFSTLSRVTPDGTATAGEWNHWTVVASGGSSLEIYKDGVAQTLTTLSTEDNGLNGSATANTHKLQIGSTGSTLYSQSDVQNVRIYDRALSATEVEDLYNEPWAGVVTAKSAPPQYLTVDTADSINTGLQGFWPLSDGDGTTAVDLTANGNDAVVTTGLPTWDTTEKGVALSGGNPMEAPAFPVTNVDAFSVVAWIDSNGSSGNWLGAWAGEQPTKAVLLRRNLMQAFVRNAANSAEDFITLNTALSGVGTGLVQVVFVVDSGNAKLYTNGELNAEDASFMAGPYIPASATEFAFGNAQATSFPAGSNIQNARVYDRALSAAEVSRLYQDPWAGTDRAIEPSPTVKDLDTSSSLTTDLVGWWPLTEYGPQDTLAYDISGGGNHGVANGGIQRQFTDVVRAATFDGVDDYFDTGSNTIVTSFPITVSAWVSPGAVTRDIIFGSYRATGTSRSFQCEINSAGRMEMISSSDGTFQATNKVSGTTTLPSGSFSHVVFVFEGSGGSLYLNGSTESSSGSLFSSLNTPVVDCLIGAEGQSGTTAHYFDGNLQNVRLYDRALSAAEVQTLYDDPWVGLATDSLVYAYYSAAFLQRL